ncbi:MAG: squalene/phytoene synthase family protein [Nanoarchaeota archaeon]|nr:squalene/phytoene synthase family protein [Nanoarchaeota archaeon]
MVNSLFPWPRPYEIIQKSQRGETLTSDDLLAVKSVSFYSPIKLLGISRGKNESDKEIHVRTTYNLLRELDESEDAPDTLSNNDKVWVINRLSYLIGEVVRRDPAHSGGIEDLINGEDLQSVTKKLVDNAIDDKARVFVEHFGKGIVLRDLYEIGKEPKGREIRESIDYCVKSMADGMTRFLERGPIQTKEQLHDYCFHVAGRIGSGFLNRLIEYKDPVKGKIIRLNDNLAQKFGEYLQLTNISKNIRTDFKENRRFFPREFIPKEVSYEYMMDGKGVDAESARQKVLNDVLLLAENNFDSSVEYIKSIPQSLSGYRAFCAVPLIMANRTIQNMRNAGAEKVYRGEDIAIKMQDNIMNIIDFAHYIVKQENGKSLDKFMEEYIKNPNKYIFTDNEYTSWRPNWVKTA